MLRPIIAQQNCISCHQHQGLREGEVAGAVGVSVPMKGLLAMEEKRLLADGVSLLIVWFLGLLLMTYAFWHLGREQQKRLEIVEELRRSETRKSVIMESALDSIITMDHQGHIVEFNRAAEKVFGYKRHQVIGREVADVLVPESLRGMHREGLRRHLSNGSRRIMGGRNRVHLFRQDDMDLARLQGEMRWVGRIQDAFESGRFSLYCQLRKPLDQLSGGSGWHCEILIRMQDEKGGFVVPVTFLAAAERYGLMPTIDRWVVNSTFEWLESHPEYIDRMEMCSINLSGHSTTDEEFLNYLIRQLDHYQISKGCICFEITETVAVSNLAHAVKFIETLRKLRLPLCIG
ncbi:MAG: EAL domain-containing protein [Gammaproteobacteria bacterium]|nr:EAL domain-containing protein [Gammaproteobacteria bacterium]